MTDWAAIAERAGNPGEALRVLSRALDTGEDAASVTPVLAPLIARMRPTRYHAKLDRDLLACLQNEAIDPQPLSRAAAGLLLAKYPGAIDLDTAGRDPLWLAFLARCLNTSPAMEARLGQMRRSLLAEPPSDLACAMALQDLMSQHVASAGTDDRLQAHPLLKRSRDDALEEHRLAAAIPSFGGGTHNAVSAKVREQYEEHPYPRWQAPPVVHQRKLRELVAGLPGVDPARIPDPLHTVLAAGCGTGYEAIDIARTDPTLAVTALDLSRASLAYGQRIANELGVPNLAFAQGDILDLATSDYRFDLVTCTGVLHHMEHPAQGLAALRHVTAPGGLIRLGLYSERARVVIAEARAYIREQGLEPTPEGIRAFRRHVLALPPEAPLASLRDSDDFYSLSGCRDLVFHVQEHVFTLPSATALVEAAGLKLVGLDAPPWALHAHREMHGATADPLDPQLWDALEARHPATFAGMYQFWCQRA